MIFLDLIEVFWPNKMRKDGLPEQNVNNSLNVEFSMSYAMKSGFYKLGMKEKNPIKILKQLFK